MSNHPQRIPCRFGILALLVCCFVIHHPLTANAQAVTIGIFSDENRSSCSLSDAGGGLVRAYVVVNAPSGMTGVRFAAPKPACFQADWIADEVPAGFVSIGDSQSDISIALGVCRTGLTNVLTMVFQKTSSTAACCEFPIVIPAGQSEVQYSDCSFTQLSLPSTSAYVNADETCPCGSTLDLPPNAPYDPTPYDTADRQPVPLTLTWKAADPEGLPLHFDVYLGTDANPPLFASNVTTSSLDVNTLAFDTAYHWKVVAFDALNQATPGPVWSFKTDVERGTPPSPVNVAPANGAISQPRVLRLDWATSGGTAPAVGYEVHFGTTQTPPVVATLPPAQSYWDVTGLAFDTDYFWYVVVKGDGDKEKVGDLWTFRTTATDPPPLAPGSPIPANNAVDVSLETVLHWVGTDPESQPLEYDVYLGADPNPPLHAHTTVPELSVSLTEHHYYWRVEAIDPAGQRTSGPIWAFTTNGNHAPLAPSNPTPPDVAIDVTRTPTLTWECSDPDGDALTYYVYFCDWYIPPYVATVTTREFTPAGPLLRGATYYWKIVAVDAGGATSTGPVWSFKTSTADVAPSGDVNADGAVTVADAQCALEAYLYAPIVLPSACGGAGGALRGDVDCSNMPTPADAYCIFRNWLDKSCSFCSGGANTVLRQAAPRLALRVLHENEDVVVVLQVSGVPSVGALGFEVQYPDGFDLVRVEPSRQDVFAALQTRSLAPGRVRVGAYANGVPVSIRDGDMLAVRLHGSASSRDQRVTLEKFVDDLAGAQAVSVSLDAQSSVPVPDEIVLHQNSPNPFNPQTAIRFELPEAMRVRLSIFDVHGKLVRLLLDERRDAGASGVEWNGTDDRGVTVATGVYFYVLDAGGKRYQHKMVMLK